MNDSQVTHFRVMEDAGHRQYSASPPCRPNQAHRYHRVAAELKKAVIAPDAVYRKMQYLGP
jgi:hypothetical protein